jgi:hypothetical protein
MGEVQTSSQMQRINNFPQNSPIRKFIHWGNDGKSFAIRIIEYFIDQKKKTNNKNSSIKTFNDL